MQLAHDLGGVISGEHGIGITKLEFLTDAEICATSAPTSSRIDPDGRFNSGKLMPGGDLRNAYTPSFNLLGHESLIMQQSDIGAISDSIKDCLRCGKCKPVCATHVPRANLLYSPRNKILATSLLVEAFLYEEQTRRGVSLAALRRVLRRRRPLHRLPQVRDALPGGHRLRRRLGGHAQLAAAQGKKTFNAGTAASMFFLNATDPDTIKLVAQVHDRLGLPGPAPRHNGCRSACRKTQTQRRLPRPARPPIKRAGHALHQQADAGRTAEEDGARAARYRGHTTSAGDPRSAAHGEDSEAVFYFPGCGSERLFSQVGLATQAMLWHVGVQTVLPPGYLCCGYPQTRPGSDDKADKIITDNRVLFHRVANTLNYLDIKTVVVSCGTCYGPVAGIRVRQDLPRLPPLDIHEFLMEKGVKLEDVNGVRYMYHDPCHSPMKSYEPLKVVNTLMDADERQGREERPLLRRVRHARRHAARRVHPGALPQGGGDAKGVAATRARAVTRAR